MVSFKQASVDQEAAVDVDPVLHRVPEVEVGLLDQHRAEGSWKVSGVNEAALPSELLSSILTRKLSS